jgi:hypothetical protein
MCMGRERTIIGRAPGYQNTSRFIRIILTHRPTFVNLCKLYIAQLEYMFVCILKSKTNR